MTELSIRNILVGNRCRTASLGGGIMLMIGIFMVVTLIDPNVDYWLRYTIALMFQVPWSIYWIVKQMDAEDRK